MAIYRPEPRHPTGRRQIFHTLDRHVMEFRSVKDGKILAKLGQEAKTKKAFSQFMFSDDGKTAALVSSTGTIHIWTIPEIKP